MNRATRCAAPGKLLLSGAYAVLEGAPAIVCAVNRFAYAHDGEGEPTAEARAALANPPAVDARELSSDGKKLGLGSSAAALVASLSLRAAERGDDIESEVVREKIFEEARTAHARVQSGGSGVDIAASTFGGVLRYTLSAPHAVDREHVTLPPVVIAAFFSGTSVRTSDLRAKVDALRVRDAAKYFSCFAALGEAARAGSDAVRTNDARAFIAALALAAPALASLGNAADAPIFPSRWSSLCDVARAESAAFVPSGAGGGDTFVFVGTEPPSASFMERARSASMTSLALAIESRGVHVAEMEREET